MPDSRGSSALAGAGTGAATGAMLGSEVLPGWGTAIGGALGAIGGGLVGYFSGKDQNSAYDAQRQATDEAMKRLQQAGQQQYANRMSDLKQIMAFYDTPNAYLQNIYKYGAGNPASQAATAYMRGSGGMPPLQPMAGGDQAVRQPAPGSMGGP